MSAAKIAPPAGVPPTPSTRHKHLHREAVDHRRHGGPRRNATLPSDASPHVRAHTCVCAHTHAHSRMHMQSTPSLSRSRDHGRHTSPLLRASARVRAVGSTESAAPTTVTHTAQPRHWVCVRGTLHRPSARERHRGRPNPPADTNGAARRRRRPAHNLRLRRQPLHRSAQAPCAAPPSAPRSRGRAHIWQTTATQTVLGAADTAPHEQTPPAATVRTATTARTCTACGAALAVTPAASWHCVGPPITSSVPTMSALATQAHRNAPGRAAPHTHLANPPTSTTRAPAPAARGMHTTARPNCSGVGGPQRPPASPQFNVHRNAGAARAGVTRGC